MRVALCLSGQARNIESKVNDIINNIITLFNCDVFIHTWYDPTNTNINKLCPGYENHNLSHNIPSIIKDILKPKSYIIECQPNFKNSRIPILTDENIDRCFDYAKRYDNKSFTQNRNLAMYGMFMSLHKSIELKYLYELENDFQYDVVIKTRMDNCPIDRLPIETIEPNTIYYYDIGQPLDMISDWMAMGDSLAMNKYGNVVFEMENYIKKSIEVDGIYCPELILKYYLKSHGLNTKAIKIRTTW